MTDEKQEAVEEPESNISDVPSMDQVFDESGPETTEESGEEEKGETEASAEETSEEESEEKTDEESEPPSEEDTSGLREALLAERRRRQQAQKELKELQEKQQEVPDINDDPEGYQKWLENDINQKNLRNRIELSRDLMMDAKEDFSDKEKVFMQLISDEDGNIIDETLQRKFYEAPNPAKFAYETAAEHMRVQELKDPSYLESKIAEAVKKEREKWEAEQKKKGDTVSATEVPELTEATAKGNNSNPTPSDKGSLEEVFDD